MLSRSRKRSATSTPRGYLLGASIRNIAGGPSLDALHEHDTLFLVGLLQPDFDDLAVTRLDGPADEAGFDRELAMASVDQHHHAHAAGAAEIEETVHCRACGASRVEDVVYQEHVFIVHGKGYFARMKHRLGGDLGEIVAVKRDIQGSHRHFEVFYAMHGAGDSLRQGHSPSAYADQRQVCRAAAFLHD